jgi:hypothetical protein
MPVNKTGRQRLSRQALRIGLLAVLLESGSPLGFAQNSAGLASDRTADFQPLLQKYCWECHDRDTAKARLSLEDTPAQFEDPGLLDRWTRVFDKVTQFEMPPPDQPQPTLAERKTLLSWLGQNLTKASRERQLREGRSPLRRLTRTEYSHSVNDLLGIQVEVLDLLPEDNRVGGFDKVSRGIDVSAQHWLRYQQAAQRAMDAALPSNPPRSQRNRFTGREWFDQQLRVGGRLAELALRASVRVEGKSATLYAQSAFHPHLQIVAGLPHAPGRYRLRASLQARSNGGNPVPVLIFLSGYQPDADPTLQRIIDVKDIPETTARTVDLEINVPHYSDRWKNQSIALVGWSLTQQRQPGALEAEAALNEKPGLTGPGLTLNWVEFEGPLDPFPTLGHRRVLGDEPLTNRRLEQRWDLKPSPATRPEPAGTPSADRQSDPRRPVTTDPVASEADRLVDRLASEILPQALPGEALAAYRLYARRRLEQGDDLSQAMKAIGQAMLSSPHFLFRVESPGRLDGPAVAARLAAFLWNSVPDTALLTRAKLGQLTEPAQLRTEVERLLNDPRSWRFITDFAHQWLDLRNIHATTPDLMYGEFDSALLWSMPQETYGFLLTLLSENRSIEELVRSDWSYLNARLARHYGIQGVAGWELRKAKLPAQAHRGGVITHASILKVTANGTSTSPVLRGKWILDRILGQPPSPPPADTPAIEPDIRGASTIREQLEKHRQLASCARCHRWIDPPGFALETFDVIGGWRDWYRVKSEVNGRAALPNYPHLKVWKGPLVEQGYRTAAGKPFTNIDDYRSLLLEDRDQIARSLIYKLIAYATGTEIQFADREVVEAMLPELRTQGYRFRDLIHAVTQSRMFLEK